MQPGSFGETTAETRRFSGRSSSSTPSLPSSFFRSSGESWPVPALFIALHNMYKANRVPANARHALTSLRTRRFHPTLAHHLAPPSVPFSDKVLHFVCFFCATALFYTCWVVEEQARRVWFWRWWNELSSAVVCLGCASRGLSSSLISCPLTLKVHTQSAASSRNSSKRSSPHTPSSQATSSRTSSAHLSPSSSARTTRANDGENGNCEGCTTSWAR